MFCPRRLEGGNTVNMLYIVSRFVGEPVNSASTECKDREHSTAALISE